MKYFASGYASGKFLFGAARWFVSSFSDMKCALGSGEFFGPSLKGEKGGRGEVLMDIK